MDDFDPEEIMGDDGPVWTKNEAAGEDDVLADVWDARKELVVAVEEGLEAFPQFIFDLPSTGHIQTLYLFNNFLPSIPASVSHLTNLRVLDVSHNRIATIHDNLALLPHLTTLNLADNKLPHVPDVVFRLTSLQTLQLSSNHITHLPHEVQQLVSLTCLELRYNQIGKLPDSMATMTKLTTLNLFNNVLESFPEPLLLMSGLYNLELRNNPIPSIPDNITKYLPTAHLSASVPHKVLEGLFIGDYATATNMASLKHSKISHILTVMNSAEPPPYPSDFVYKKFHVMDDEDEDLFSIFENSHSFIESGRNQSGVLVHCAAGISRSATIVLSYLIKMRKSTFDQELEYLRNVRPIVDPNPGFVKQLKRYEKNLEYG